MVAKQSESEFGYVSVAEFLEDDTSCGDFSVDAALSAAENTPTANLTPGQQLQLEQATPRECRALANVWGISATTAVKIRRRARNRASAAKSRQKVQLGRAQLAREKADLKALVESLRSKIAEMAAKIAELEAATPRVATVPL
jgi:hypothetical protein